MATKGATKRTTRTSSTAVTPPPEIENTPANCRAREMIVRVADKWSMYVIHVLADAGPLRFNEIRRRVDGVSQRMLTVTLRDIVGELIDWSGRHLAEVDRARARYDERAKQPNWATVDESA